MQEHTRHGRGWKERQAKHQERQEKEISLLQQWCQGDSKLYDWVSKTLYLEPVGGIFDQSIDVLTAEGIASGDFRPAIDKALFESSQKPAEKEKYVKIIRDLVSRAIVETERELKTGEHDSEHTDFLKKRIENRKYLGEKVEAILDVATKFYKERLEDMARREQFRKDKEEAAITAKKAEDLAKAGK